MNGKKVQKDEIILLTVGLREGLAVVGSRLGTVVGQLDIEGVDVCSRLGATLIDGGSE